MGRPRRPTRWEGVPLTTMVAIRSVNKRTKSQRPPRYRTQSAKLKARPQTDRATDTGAEVPPWRGRGLRHSTDREGRRAGRQLSPPPPRGHLPGPREVPRSAGTNGTVPHRVPSTGTSSWSVTGPWRHGGNPTVLLFVTPLPCGVSGTLELLHGALCPDRVLLARKDTITVTWPWPQPPHSAPLSANERQGPGRPRGWEGNMA